MKNLIFIGTFCLLMVVVLCKNETTTEGSNSTVTSGPTTVTTPKVKETTVGPTNATKETNTTSGQETTTAVTKPPQTTVTSKPTTPGPKPGDWKVSDKNGTVCIRMTATIDLIIQYTKTDNKTVNVTYNVPGNAATATGSCGKNTQRLEISETTTWSPHLVFVFETVSKDQFKISNTTFSFKRTADKFPDAKDKGVPITARLDKDFFTVTVSKSNSYSCKTKAVDRMSENVVLNTESLQVQAFMTGNKGDFGSEVACTADSVTSNIVPIAVGAALAGLVVIVLIAYLIGRRRNQRGYESV